MKLIKQLIAEYEEKQRVNLEEGVSSEECDRIASYWKGKAAKMTDAELRSAIGNDLEQLEYSPEEVSKAVPRILRKVKS